MRKQTHIRYHTFFLLVVVTILSLSACGAPAAPVASPTQTVEAIYTSAAQTFTAQQAAQPTSAPATAAPIQAPTTSAGANGVPVTGATAAPGATSGTAAPQCNSLTYVADATIPDGTVMAPGTVFTKTWTVRNTGTCQWTTGYKLTFFNGESMGGTSVTLTAPVPAGATTQLSVNLTAPVVPGSYTGGWQLVDAHGNRFGDMITVVITVSGTGSTSITATP